MNETSLILEKATALLKNKGHILIAIDGRCAAGKTTLAERLRELSNCAVIHIDDFFLRPEQRTEQRYNEPGGNIDYERFSEEVIKPLLKNIPFAYKPYDCKTGGFSQPISVTPNKITIVEGWDTVGEEWNTSSDGSSISFTNTATGLDNGTYRVKTVFNVTDKNGKAEKTTLYSAEKSVN